MRNGGVGLFIEGCTFRFSFSLNHWEDSASDIYRNTPSDHASDAMRTAAYGRGGYPSPFLLLHVGRSGWVALYCIHDRTYIDLLVQRIAKRYQGRRRPRTKKIINATKDCKRTERNRPIVSETLRSYDELSTSPKLKLFFLLCFRFLLEVTPNVSAECWRKLP